MKKLFFISIVLFLSSCKKWETHKRTRVYGIVYDMGNEKPIPQALITLSYYGWSDKKKLFDLSPDMESKIVYQGRTNQNGEYSIEFDAYDPKTDDGLTNYVISYNSEEKIGLFTDYYDNKAVNFLQDQPPNYYQETGVLYYGEDNKINLFKAFLSRINYQFTNLPIIPEATDSFSLTMTNRFGTKTLEKFFSETLFEPLNDFWLDGKVEVVSAPTTFHLSKKSNGVITTKDTLINIPPSPEKVTIYLPVF